LRLFSASAQVFTARRCRMQDKTLDMSCTYSYDRFSSTKNFSDNLGACQVVGGRLAADNRRYRLPVRLYCCCLHCRTCECV